MPACLTPHMCPEARQQAPHASCRYDDACNGTNHDALIRKLIQDDGAHFLFGSTPVFAQSESVIANDAERLLYHCCVGPDPIYELVGGGFGVPTTGWRGGTRGSCTAAALCRGGVLRAHCAHVCAQLAAH